MLGERHLQEQYEIFVIYEKNQKPSKHFTNSFKKILKTKILALVAFQWYPVCTQ